MKFQDYLLSINACEEARAWNADRDLQTCWQECERGDWMLWLMKKANLCDLRTLTLAKAKCAELAKPYMKDERSLAALRAAFDFANGLSFNPSSHGYWLVSCLLAHQPENQYDKSILLCHNF